MRQPCGRACSPTSVIGTLLLNHVSWQTDGSQLLWVLGSRPASLVHIATGEPLISQFGEIFAFARLNDIGSDLDF